MPWRERKLTDGFAIELSGQKIGPGLSEADRCAIYDAAALHGVCVVPSQTLSDDDIFDFATSLEDEVVIDTPLEGVPFTRVWVDVIRSPHAAELVSVEGLSRGQLRALGMMRSLVA